MERTIKLFGKPQVQLPDGTVKVASPKAMEVLTVLLLKQKASNNPVPRQTLAQAIWPESSLERALDELYRYVGDLRNDYALLGFVSRDRTEPLQIETSRLGFDILQFDQWIASGDEELAVKLYNGLLLKRSEVKEVKELRDLTRQQYLDAVETIAIRRQQQDNLGEGVDFICREILRFFDEPDISLFLYLKLAEMLAKNECRTALETVFEVCQKKFRRHEEFKQCKTTRVRLLSNISSTDHLLTGSELFDRVLGTNKGTSNIQSNDDPSDLSDDSAKTLTSHTKVPDNDLGSPNEPTRVPNLSKQPDLNDVREKIKNDFDNFKAFGLEAGPPASLYQHLTLRRDNIRVVSNADDSNSRGPRGTARDSSLKIDDVLQELNQTDSVWRLPLLAESGAGKTALLHWIACQAAEKADFMKRDGKCLIPALISLPELQASSDTVAEFLKSRHEIGPDVETWEYLLQNGDCLLLLDGIELSNPQETNKLLRHYGHCPAILTCRPVLRERLKIIVENSEGGLTWPSYELESLSENQQREYVKKYPGLTPEIHEILQRLIQERADLWSIFSNPYTLSLQCFIAKNRTLPSNYSPSRTSLYNAALEIIVQMQPEEPLRRRIRDSDPLRGEAIEALSSFTLYAVTQVLTSLYETAKQETALYAKQKNLTEAIGEFLSPEMFGQGLKEWRKGKNYSEAQCDCLKEDLFANSHVMSGITDRGIPTKVKFIHQSWREYLVAVALADKVKDKNGWKCIRHYVNALAWLPEFESTLLFLAGTLAERKQFSVLQHMLTLLSDHKQDDQFRHRLSLAAQSIPELTHRTISQELVQQLEFILQKVVSVATDTIRYADLDGSTGTDDKYPMWLERLPIGRALYAIGSSYEVKKNNNNAVGIPLGAVYFDPIGLNEKFPARAHEAPQHITDQQRYEDKLAPTRILVDRKMYEALISKSWLLNLLGPACALLPIQKKIIEWQDQIQWDCLHSTLAASLRYSRECNASEWFSWLQNVIQNYKGGLVYDGLASVLTQTSISIRNMLIEDILTYLENTPAYTIRNYPSDRDEYVQDCGAYVLSFLLQVGIPEDLRSRALRILTSIPHPDVGLCLLNLGFGKTDRELLAKWQNNVDVAMAKRYITALRLMAEEISVEEALPDITKDFDTLVFNSPNFVNVLTDEQRYAVLASMLKNAMSYRTGLWLYEEVIGIIARSGSVTLRQWLREELRLHIVAGRHEWTEKFLWQTLISLGGDSISNVELAEYIRCLVLPGDTSWHSQLIRKSGAHAVHDEAIRLQLMQAVRGIFAPEIHEEYRTMVIEYLDDEIVSFEKNHGSIHPVQRAVTNTRLIPLRKKRDWIASQPASSLTLPGLKNVRLSATIALSYGGIDFFSEDIRNFVCDSYWWIKKYREFDNFQPPLLGWIQAGLRIFPKLMRRTDGWLTLELAARAFQHEIVATAISQ